MHFFNDFSMLFRCIFSMLFRCFFDAFFQCSFDTFSRDFQGMPKVDFFDRFLLGSILFILNFLLKRNSFRLMFRGSFPRDIIYSVIRFHSLSKDLALPFTMYVAFLFDILSTFLKIVITFYLYEIFLNTFTDFLLIFYQLYF